MARFRSKLVFNGLPGHVLEYDNRDFAILHPESNPSNLVRS